jgi:hypothetical protein
MATEKRLIDANALKALFDERYDDAFMQALTRPNIAHWEGYSIGVNWGRNTIADAPTVDAVEVVRCCDCLHCIPWQQYADAEVILYCKKKRPAVVDPTDFCSRGERRTDV